MAADNLVLRRRLFSILNNQFDIEDLQTICFLIGVDYDSLRGEGKAAKARELIAQVERQEQVSILVEAGKDLRPDVQWPIVASDLPFPEPEMLLIPAGEFLMGSDPSTDREAKDEERPQHALYLPDYYLAKTPVIDAQYFAFVQATGHRWPKHWVAGTPPRGKDDYPVVGVTWEDAFLYCHWLKEVTGKAYCLPSEPEWEKGARGADGRVYPWGNEWDSERCNAEEGISRKAMSVGAYLNGASPYGLLDMAGNVWEWTRSLGGKQYPYDPSDGREELDAGYTRVLRGGAYDRGPGEVRCAFRRWIAHDTPGANVGFRVCVVAQ